MARPMDAVLDYVSCRTLFWVLGALTGFSVLRTGLEAGQGGIWGWWLLLALLFGALWAYTWFYCGREAITGEREIGRADAGVTTAATPPPASGSSSDAPATSTVPKARHWARPAEESGAAIEAGDKRSAEGTPAGKASSAVGTASTTSETSRTENLVSSSDAKSAGSDSDDGGGGHPSGASKESGGGIRSSATPTSARSDPDSDVEAVSGDPAGEKPPALQAARGGKADDLKQISGVGPKLEGLLHSLGFFHFDQIAAWTAQNVAWVDDHLGFKGRIDRDGWVGQSKTLAAGETTDFAERVARGEVESSKKS